MFHVGRSMERLFYVVSVTSRLIKLAGGCYETSDLTLREWVDLFLLGIVVGRTWHRGICAENVFWDIAIYR